jgi:Zn-dependent membrane protease YugP
MIFDPLYLLMLAPALLLAVIAQLLVKHTFNKYSKVRSYSGLTGAQAAERMIRSNGIFDVQVEETSGFLSDHYDPSKKVLRLSPDVYQSNSLAAVGIACHEAGHAMQHAQGYVPLVLRTTLVPATMFSSQFAYIVFFIGLVFQIKPLLFVGIGMFACAFIFSVITLPVEWDASSRAKQHMVTAGIVSPMQERDAGKVLNAAFLTYLAGAVAALMTLLYYLMKAGLLGDNRRR